jgi:TP901-1 family phage major tail protein
MASAEKGDVVTFYVEDAVGTLVAVASERSASLSYELEEIDTSAKGDTTRTSTPGKVKISGSIEGLYVHSDTAQARFITLVESGAQIEAAFYRSGSIWKNGTAQITNLSLNWSDAEAATFSCDFSFDGGLTTT